MSTKCNSTTSPQQQQAVETPQFIKGFSSPFRMSQLSSAGRSLQAAAILLLAVTAAAATVQMPAIDAACHNDIVALQSTCFEYVQEGAPTLMPSPSCCAAMIGVTNVRCVCDYLGSDMDVDMDKVFYVTRQCGITIPRNCGD